MNFHALLRTIIPFTFIILSATSSVFVLASTINYARFYPALAEVQYSIVSVSFFPGSVSTGGNLQVSFVVENPTDYSGLRVAQVLISIYFVSPNFTLFKTAEIAGSGQYFAALPPHVRVVLNMNILLDTEQSRSLQSFYSNSSTRILARSILSPEISTFLDTSLGYINVNPDGTTSDTPLSVTS